MGPVSPEPARSDHGPWVDVHAHPGRCFLAGLEPGDPIRGALGPDTCDDVLPTLGPVGVAAVAFATVADLRVIRQREDGGLQAFREFDPGEAAVDHRRQLAAITALGLRHGLSIVRDAADIESAHQEGRTAMFVTCEGADFVEDDPDLLADAHDAGVRSITIVHYRQNRFGDLQTAPHRHGGLSGAGRDLVRTMNELGMVVDLAHASFETTVDVVEVSTDPVLISHTHLDGGHRTNARLISTEHARVVAAAGGVIGAWPAGVSSKTLDDFIDEIARLVEAVGIDHVAIGTDMDANYRPVMTEHGQFAALDAGLAARGFSPADADKVLGGNAVALIGRVCG